VQSGERYLPDLQAICSQQDTSTLYFSVTSHLLELYQEYVNDGGWARVLYDAHGGMERLSFRKIPPNAPVTSPPPPSTRQLGPQLARRGIPARGGEHVTGCGERPWLRGCVPARSPVPSPQLLWSKVQPRPLLPPLPQLLTLAVLWPRNG
jgi:hypothetical protein